MQKILSRTKVLLWKTRSIIPFWDKLERLRGFRVFRGDQSGFANMLECGEVSPELGARVFGKGSGGTSTRPQKPLTVVANR
jgi:hypothetical protein